MSSGNRGKEKLPATSSDHVYLAEIQAGLQGLQRQVIWKMTALRSGAVTSLATTGLDS